MVHMQIAVVHMKLPEGRQVSTLEEEIITAIQEMMNHCHFKENP